ncbi:MAG: hypothetical protein JW709_04425 [Sedimentisphaerales bacterium]|nr:hypothetical protein [Sedimentisphaerales bacterium]
MRNPIRRNRKIGKTQGGRVKDGRAQEKLNRVFSDNIWQALSRLPEGSKCRVLAENPSRNYYHPCTGDEYLAVLKQLPACLANHVKAIVLRRTSKLDVRLGVEARRRFSCVILNAFPTSNEMTWDQPPTASVRRHYDRWCSRWVTGPSMVKLQWTRDEIRSYYLYHLFLHEVGHINQPWFHHLRRREGFAENFALEWAVKLQQLPPSQKT